MFVSNLIFGKVISWLNKEINEAHLAKARATASTGAGAYTFKPTTTLHNASTAVRSQYLFSRGALSCMSIGSCDTVLV